MPSVSIVCTVWVPGDGGGVCSARRDGGSVRMDKVFVFGGLIKAGGGDGESCDLLGFLVTGSSSMTVAGGEGWDCEEARERLGTVMPSSERDSDFLLVLYGMLGGLNWVGQESCGEWCIQKLIVWARRRFCFVSGVGWENVGKHADWKLGARR